MTTAQHQVHEIKRDPAHDQVDQHGVAERGEDVDADHRAGRGEGERDRQLRHVRRHPAVAPADPDVAGEGRDRHGHDRLFGADEARQDRDGDDRQADAGQAFGEGTDGNRDDDDGELATASDASPAGESTSTRT